VFWRPTYCNCAPNAGLVERNSVGRIPRLAVASVLPSPSDNIFRGFPKRASGGVRALSIQSPIVPRGAGDELVTTMESKEAGYVLFPPLTGILGGGCCNRSHVCAIEIRPRVVERYQQ
jgi:hypothetical protein